ncbi:MAG: Fur family transcriptional regulator [Firmicutes bacterium]|nr:Fur family transcriptional regulator [Bacillota bacterium]
MEIKDVLKNKGLKITKKRIGILKVLDMVEYPVDVLEIKDKLNDNDIEINLSTVYRALEDMAEVGIVNRVNFSSDTRVFYELNRNGHHHYLHCLKCKALVIIDGCPLDDYQEDLAKKTKYDLTGHNLDIYGYCPKCQDKK